MLQMFAFDLFTLIISGVSLRHFSNIDLFKEFCNMMEMYWIVFLLKLSSLALNFGQRDINFAMDYSMEFSWLTDEGLLNLTCNALDLSYEKHSGLLPNLTMC